MIRDLHKKILEGETTSVKLTERYLETINKKDGEIGAYLSVFKDEARRQAEQVDAKIKKGERIDIIEGIPCAVKDNICLNDSVTTAGSKILENYKSPYDATVVGKIKENGAVILGKTNLDEFAMGSSTENSAYKTTKNPLDTNRVAGGSSGGSAAAVASGEAVWALGSDTGGSIRQPASFCGVVGMKPTYGRVSRYGLMAMASSLDQIGTLCESVEDSAIILSKIAGEDSLDATSAKSADKPYEDYLTGKIKGLKIGVAKEYFGADLDIKIRETSEKALDKFRELGAIVEEISLPHSQYALPVYYILMPSEVSSNLARFDGIRFGQRKDESTILGTYLSTRSQYLGKEAKRRVMLGTHALSSGYYDAYYLKAQKVRRLIKKDFEKAFKSVDLIFSPTAPETAFKIGEKSNDPLKMYLSDIYTVTANLVGIPAISFPIGEIDQQSGTGGLPMPIGGQLMGKWFDEENVFNVAHAYEISEK